jgi:hypothetical protein
MSFMSGLANRNRCQSKALDKSINKKEKKKQNKRKNYKKNPKETIVFSAGSRTEQKGSIRTHLHSKRRRHEEQEHQQQPQVDDVPSGCLDGKQKRCQSWHCFGELDDSKDSQDAKNLGA